MTDPDRNKPAGDSAAVLRYMLIKAAIFIGIPVIASVLAVVFMLR